MSKTPPLRIGVVCFSTFGGSGVVAAEVASSLAGRGCAARSNAAVIVAKCLTATGR